MIGKLPLEIQVRLLHLDPSSALKHVNSHFYMLYNDLFYDKIVQTFGEDIVVILLRILPWIKAYVKTLDAFRYTSRAVIASRLELKDDDGDSRRDSPHNNPLHCMYIKDSWKYIYSILKNKRFFAEYNDYKIDEPTNYIFNHFVEVNRSYLLSYTKKLWLAPGRYNLNIGLVIKHGTGLGTTKFEIKYDDSKGKEIIQTFYPPTNINEILPKRQFCLLKIGEFVIPNKSHDRDSGKNKNLYQITFTMEEIGLYLKSGFRIFFIDIAQPSLLFNDYDLLYYTVKETDYRYFINIPLKNLYKALNYVQNETLEKKIKTVHDDKLPLPTDIWEQYDHSFLKGYNFNGETSLAKKHPNDESAVNLEQYGEFYFNNRLKRRLFKFNTVYQRRQFINRFGDFELDWREANQTDDNSKGSRAKSRKTCSYDVDGLKWKIPIVGEL